MEWLDGVGISYFFAESVSDIDYCTRRYRVARARSEVEQVSMFLGFGVDNRPYRVFITTPVIFCCAALFLLSRGIFSAPLQALFAAIFILAGVPLYYIFITGWRHIPGLRI